VAEGPAVAASTASVANAAFPKAAVPDAGPAIGHGWVQKAAANKVVGVEPGTLDSALGGTTESVGEQTAVVCNAKEVDLNFGAVGRAYSHKAAANFGGPAEVVPVWTVAASVHCNNMMRQRPHVKSTLEAATELAGKFVFAAVGSSQTPVFGGS
jgi:DNA-binding transcriptional regulator LsrR (DeoR family)